MLGNTVFGLMVIVQTKKPGKGVNIAKNSLKGTFVKTSQGSTKMCGK